MTRFSKPGFLTLTLGCLAGVIVLRGVMLRAGNATGEWDPRPPAGASSVSPFVDAHTHLDSTNFDRSIEAALQAMPLENAAKIVVMPPPFTLDDAARYDADLILPKARGYRGKLAVLGGGGTLNAMIHESARTGDAGPEVQRRFKQQAEELLRAGAAGFGEMAAEHFQGGTAYQSVPPDHPLFLLLAEIAAEHDVPIDLHMEAVSNNMPLPPEVKSPPNPPRLRENIHAFERLLSHNARARIIWAHAGSDNTGDRTPELCRHLLAAHTNLYMELKIDPANPGRNPLLTGGASGRINPEWLRLFDEFPGRFVVGTDQHYPEPATGLQRWTAVVLLLNQLPDRVRQQIARDNAVQLYTPRSHLRRPR